MKAAIHEMLNLDRLRRYRETIHVELCPRTKGHAIGIEQRYSAISIQRGIDLALRPGDPIQRGIGTQRMTEGTLWPVPISKVLQSMVAFPLERWSSARH
ncbi:hypothetical protein HDC30_002453 [Pseudomonas sp. JAI115]|nr:hypothetical protein [Pseudomonas sp. JAI115]MBB6155230.1 hypothetical protein [Pseudomonas sp. JAI115]